MYNDDVLRIPDTDIELWKVLREHFVFIVDVLERTPVETKEDALDNSYHAIGQKGQVIRDAAGLIRFKNVSEEYDNRDYYLELGRQLIPYIESALEQQQLTPEFVQQWGKVMFCHGYIAAHIFDDTDDLHTQRAGLKGGEKRSKDAQRKWLAHILLPLMKEGQTRQQAEDKAAGYIQRIIDSGKFTDRFDRDWFASMLSRGELAATYDAKHFLQTTMRALVQEPIDDIPPIPKLP